MENNKIYEPPDKGKTLYQREFGNYETKKLAVYLHVSYIFYPYLIELPLLSFS